MVSPLIQAPLIEIATSSYPPMEASAAKWTRSLSASYTRSLTRVSRCNGALNMSTFPIYIPHAFGTLTFFAPRHYHPLGWIHRANSKRASACLQVLRKDTFFKPKNGLFNYSSSATVQGASGVLYRRSRRIRNPLVEFWSERCEKHGEFLIRALYFKDIFV